MKKLLSLTLAIVMVFLMVACNATPNSDDKGNDKAEFSRGKIEGDVYTNEFLGFEFTKPESWVYSTDEEIAALVNLSVDTILGDNFKDALENNPSVYDMMVTDLVTRSNINVGYENLAKTFSTNITIKQYVDMVKKQLSNVEGMTTTFSDNMESVKLGEAEFTKVVCNTTASGVSMTQVYYLQKVDEYMCFVIVTIPSGYNVEEIEAMFK